MSARQYIVMTGTAENPIAEHASESLPAAVEFWGQEAMRNAGAWLEVTETRRIVGHEELTDAGAASLAARVAEYGNGGYCENEAMPRLGEHKPEVFACNQESGPQNKVRK